MQKRFVTIPAAAVLVAGTIVGIVANNNPPTTGADTSPVVQTLTNHEVRIRNAENNIKALQGATSTPDSPNNATVPASSPVTDGNVSQGIVSPTAASTSTPSAAPSVTVTAFKEIVLDADTSDCVYTYSDGTTYQFHWKTSNPQGSWMTDGVGQNGHWVKTVQTSGYCDQRAIGQQKS